MLFTKKIKFHINNILLYLQLRIILTNKKQKMKKKLFLVGAMISTTVLGYATVATDSISKLRAADSTKTYDASMAFVKLMADAAKEAIKESNGSALAIGGVAIGVLVIGMGISTLLHRYYAKKYDVKK